MSARHDRIPQGPSPITREPFPASRKVYVQGSIHPSVRVPMREIAQHSTRTKDGLVENPPITVYDTSGPYTDPSVDIDVHRGLDRPCEPWIEARGDTEQLAGSTSIYGLSRLADETLQPLRMKVSHAPRRALPGRRVTQLHYARQGIITPEMEFMPSERTRSEKPLPMPSLVSIQASPLVHPFPRA